MQKGFIAGFFSDLFLVSASYALCVWLKPGISSTYYVNYFNSFLLFLFIWIIISFSMEKYNFRIVSNWLMMLKKILMINLIIFFIITSMMYLFQSFNYSRFIVLGTVGVTTLAELSLGSLYFLFVNTRVRYENGTAAQFLNGNRIWLKEKAPVFRVKKILPKYDFGLREEYLKNEIGEAAFNYVSNYAKINSPDTLVIATTTRFNIDAQLQHSFECIVNVKRVNDFRYINKYFESVNAKLPVGGLFIDHFESKNMRKKRILNKFPTGINYIYYTLDFIIKRVFPKFTLTKKIYFILTRGENRVLSKAEAFGRLYSCGFEILDEKLIDKCLYFIAVKVKEPLFPKNPSYGPMVALERIGKGGKPIKVYKMRTMHPYAEYLQDYVYEKAGLQDGGKFKDDFRVTTLGKIMRSFWLDELPMLINLFKGDLKLFGVRPLSRQYFRLYTLELQKFRIQSKPGLIPPFYVDYPKTLEEIITSELKYLKAYEKHPFRTDWVYFWKAIFNIVFRRYRSR
jgi:lipopolysaccharide/colanic/teichoic acid biosynthesis glycosyltransferase